MGYEDEWYIKVIKWVVERIEKLLKEYGLIRCLIGCGIIVILICSTMNLIIFLWNLKTDIEVKPLIDSVVILEEDKKMDVMCTAKMSENLSVTSLVSELASRMSSKAEAVMLFNDLSELCKGINPQEKELVFPKGVGKSSFGDIIIYSWNTTGKFLMGDMNFREVCAVLFMNDNYIEIYAYGSERLKLGVGISMGTYN